MRRRAQTSAEQAVKRRKPGPERIVAKGYWIALITIKDLEAYSRYIGLAGNIFSKFGARFLVRGGPHRTVEGREASRHIIIEFPTFEDALACHDSTEYQGLADLRRLASSGDIVIVRGFAPPNRNKALGSSTEP